MTEPAIQRGDLVRAAREWVEAGYCVVPTHEDQGKRPFGQWKAFQSERPSWSQVEKWLESGRYTGIGVILGEVSGNAEAIEIEGPMSLAVERLNAVIAESAKYAEIGLPELLARVARGCVEQSAGGGLHLFIRVTDGPAKGNVKLAMIGQGRDRKVVSETRGQGGFMVVAPTPGRNGHPEGASYIFINGGHPSKTVEVTAEERDLLHEVFRLALDEDDEAEVAAMLVQAEHRPAVEYEGVSAFDDYRQRVSWREILEPAGWTFSHRMGDDEFWTRPGKKVADGHSAVTHGEGDCLVNFSSSVDWPVEKGLSKGHVYALLHHDGDLSAAARALTEAGYGSVPSITELPPWEAVLDPDATEEEKAVAETDWVAENLPRVDWHALWADEQEEEWIVEPLLAARRLVALYSAPKVGKAATLSTPVLTPHGWVKMGDISVGDRVVGPDGKGRTVVAVHPQGVVDIYRVTMSDGSSTECCGDHLWTLLPHGAKPKTVSTLEVKALLDAGKKRDTYIPVTEPVQYEVNPHLPIEPYCLGLLLGDGGLSTTTPTFCKPEPELHDALRGGLPGSQFNVYDTERGYGSITTPRSHGNTVTDALRDLDLMGKRSWEKRIPERYLLASIEDRLALLQGLFDTDGWVERNQYGNTKACFGTSSEQLMHDVTELAESLGGVVKVTHKQQPRHQGGVGRPAWTLRVMLPAGLCPFRLERKRDAWTAGRETLTKVTKPTRRIVSVEYVAKDEAKCITVDAPDGLYLTERFIVTHNSLLMLEIAAAIANGRPMFGYPPSGRTYRTLYIDFENDPRSDIRERLDAMGYGPDDLDNLILLSFPALAYLDTERGSLELLAAVRYYGAQVVVIDTVSRAIAGEENSNDTWLGFYKHTGLKLKQERVALIRLDHSGKDETKGQRGGSAKSGDVDAVWRLTRTGEATYDLVCEAHRFPIHDPLVSLKRVTDDGVLRHEAMGNSRRAMLDEILRKMAEAGIPRDASLRVKDVRRMLRDGHVSFVNEQVSKYAIEMYARRLPEWGQPEVGDD